MDLFNVWSRSFAGCFLCVPRLNVDSSVPGTLGPAELPRLDAHCASEVFTWVAGKPGPKRLDGSALSQGGGGGGEAGKAEKAARHYLPL